MFTCNFASLPFPISLFDIAQLRFSNIGLVEVMKRVEKMEKSSWTAKTSKPGPRKKTKVEFAESKKENLADSDE